MRQQGVLQLDVQPDALTRVSLALFLGGLILQQTWEPDVDVGGYLEAVHAIIDAITTSSVVRDE